eukprot:4457912-Prymnesium_polylepis.1
MGIGAAHHHVAAVKLLNHPEAAGATLAVLLLPKFHEAELVEAAQRTLGRLVKGPLGLGVLFEHRRPSLPVRSHRNHQEGGHVLLQEAHPPCLDAERLGARAAKVKRRAARAAEGHAARRQAALQPLRCRGVRHWRDVPLFAGASTPSNALHRAARRALGTQVDVVNLAGRGCTAAHMLDRKTLQRFCASDGCTGLCGQPAIECSDRHLLAHGAAFAALVHRARRHEAVAERRSAAVPAAVVAEAVALRAQLHRVITRSQLVEADGAGRLVDHDGGIGRAPSIGVGDHVLSLLLTLRQHAGGVSRPRPP